MTLFDELMWRGQIKDRTFEDGSWLNEPKIFYLGTDCSSDSLTIGNLAVYVLARRLVKAGWKPVLLVGGATSLIGDPGGKKAERDLLSKDRVDSNVRYLTKQVQQLLSDKNVQVVNNYDWFKDIGYLDFLRDVGKHYSMTELLQRDFVAERIGEQGSGISYAEFSYSLIQGYDFLHLYKNHQVVLQIGGSDQWGNMLSGVPLIRKKLDGEAHAMSMPLVINKATGTKFGKSEDGAVWLDEKKTSVYKFYQFWINVDDDSVEEYLKIYTELTPEELEELVARSNASPAERFGQKALAYHVTRLVHGEDRARRVQLISDAVFKGDFTHISETELAELRFEVPTVHVGQGKSIVDAILESGLVTSRTEARRLLAGRAVYINQVQISADKQSLSDNDFIGRLALLRIGKNKLALIEK